MSTNGQCYQVNHMFKDGSCHNWMVHSLLIYFKKTFLVKLWVNNPRAIAEYAKHSTPDCMIAFSL